MELSLEESLDLMLELMGSGLIILLMSALLHSQSLLTMIERMV